MFKRIALIVLAVLVVAAGVGLYAAAVPDVPAVELDARYGGPPSQFVTLPGGTRAHFRDRPGPAGAPTIVLLHGSNASLHTWEPWAAEFAGKLRVISVDLPGHGLTGATVEDDYAIEGMVEFVDSFTRAIGLSEPFVLAGNSMGGNVAWRFTLRHPERVAKLVLVDAGGVAIPGPERPMPLAFRLARTPVVRELLRFVTPRSLFESGLRDAFYDPSLVTPEMIDRYWQLNLRPGTRAANVARFSRAGGTRFASRLKEIKQPTLVLWGSDDKVISVAAADVFESALPNAKVIIYEHCGHLPMEEVAKQSAADVLAFVGAKHVTTGMTEGETK
jgi:pimeloyl-ACP methyl ester carboxylesterase